jgi:hypothetical protein
MIVSATDRSYGTVNTGAMQAAAGRTDASGKALPASDALNTDTVSISPSAQIKGIMSKYDVRNMSYDEQKRMADELRGQGLIDDEDWLDLTMPPVDFSHITGQPKPDWDARRDVIKNHENDLEFARQNGGDERSIAFIEHMLSVYRMLESHQS